MRTYYRTIFDIMPRFGEEAVGLNLLNDVEKTLRTWAHQSLGSFPELLDDPDDSDTGREWQDGYHSLRVSGRTVDHQGYFWLRWNTNDLNDGEFQRYLGLRLATEDKAVQADFEVKVTADESYTGSFDDDVRSIFETLLDSYRCVSFDGEMELKPLQVDPEAVRTFWEQLSSETRCMPVVVVSEHRGGGVPVDADALQSDLFGLARVAVCSDQAAWSLGWHSWRLMCYDGQVRVYAPNLSRDDDQLRHRVWGPDEVLGLGYDDFLQVLRDECTQRIHYPSGRDALRVFSRVRWASWHRRLEDGTERTRETVLNELSDYVDQKNEEVEREKDLRRRAEADRDHWKHLFESLRNDDGQKTANADAEMVDGIRSIQDVESAVKDWPFVRIFARVAGSSKNMSVRQAKEFFSVLSELNRCGANRPKGALGMSEEAWIHQQGITNYVGGETAATIQQYGSARRFPDDNGSEVEMPCHLKVGRKWRVHVKWSDEESCWLVGYYGNTSADVAIASVGTSIYQFKE